MDFQDAIRERIRWRLDELRLPLTGKTWTEAGIGSTTVRNFLTGMTESMTVATAEKIAPILRVSSNWLLYGDTAEVVQLWDYIDVKDRERAKEILKTFIDKDRLTDATKKAGDHDLW